MISASNASTYVTYKYDYMGRMFEKVSGSVTNDYVWDGYNIIAEISPAKTNYNVWGLDLSESMQGAGGVGGLLAVVENGTAYFACMDGNGNVTEYVDEDGDVVAHYEYSPFGGITVASESKADDFTHRFSTKPWDGDTGLIRYELRDYSSALGRWLSVDPLEEMGGIHLFGFVGNEPIARFDRLGLHGDQDERSMDRWINPPHYDPNVITIEFGGPGGRHRNGYPIMDGIQACRILERGTLICEKGVGRDSFYHAKHCHPLSKKQDSSVSRNTNDAGLGDQRNGHWEPTDVPCCELDFQLYLETGRETYQTGVWHDQITYKCMKPHKWLIIGWWWGHWDEVGTKRECRAK